MKELSIRKRLELANYCYAHVSGMFASFCNEKERGPNFTWERFVDICANRSFSCAMACIKFSDDMPQYEYWARTFSKEIAETLLKRSGFLDK